MTGINGMSVLAAGPKWQGHRAVAIMARGKEFLITDRREPSPNVKIEEDERDADALGILIWLRFSSMIE